MSNNTPQRIVVPPEPLMWSAKELGALAMVSPASMRYHRRQFSKRSLTESFPDDFPLDQRQAQRLLDYMAMRPKNKGRKK